MRLLKDTPLNRTTGNPPQVGPARASMRQMEFDERPATFFGDPVFIGSNSVQTNNGGTAIGAPQGSAPGDFGIIIQIGPQVAADVTIPGWTRLANRNSISGSVGCQVFYKANLTAADLRSAKTSASFSFFSLTYLVFRGLTSVKELQFLEQTSGTTVTSSAWTMTRSGRFFLAATWDWAENRDIAAPSGWRLWQPAVATLNSTAVVWGVKAGIHDNGTITFTNYGSGPSGQENVLWLFELG